MGLPRAGTSVQMPTKKPKNAGETAFTVDHTTLHFEDARGCHVYH
jgi:hypothetical protein